MRQVVKDISDKLELRPLLTKIVRIACELLRADRGPIGLLGRDYLRWETGSKPQNVSEVRKEGKDGKGQAQRKGEKT